MIGALTVGLRPFVDREVECDMPGTDVRALLIRTQRMTAYLLEHGAVIKDGATIGTSETERILVRLRISRRFEGLPVYAIGEGAS